MLDSEDMPGEERYETWIAVTYCEHGALDPQPALIPSPAGSAVYGSSHDAMQACDDHFGRVRRANSQFGPLAWAQEDLVTGPLTPEMIAGTSLPVRYVGYYATAPGRDEEFPAYYVMLLTASA